MGARRRLLSNTAWNVAGQLAPLVVGVLTLPLLIRLVGLERFGFITLVWVLVGYASIFDFGIGRALVRTVAAHLAHGDRPRAEASAHAGLVFLALFGVLLALALAPASAWVVGSALNVPAELVPEAVPAMVLLAVSLPFVMLTTGFAGLMSAHQRFKALNLIRIALGVASYAGPVLVAAFVSVRLDAVVAMVLLLRVAGTGAHAWACARQCGWRPHAAWPERQATRELFSLGGWIAVSNVLSPMLSYLDRLLLATLVPVRSVAIYATPYDVLSKAMVLPSSIMAALFPLASGLARGSVAAQRLLGESLRLLFVTMFPVIFLFVVFARPGLHSWLGPEIAELGAPVMQILAVGMLLNALAQGPATLIQAAGEPRWMALLHLAELPVFIGLLWLLTLHHGVLGTALASSLRNGVDAAIVFGLAQRRVAMGTLHWRAALLPAGVAGLLLSAALWPTGWAQAAAVALAGLVIFAGYAWAGLLRPDERHRLLAVLRPGLRS
ncbi:MAG: flippase [Rubrivivax sp.]|nr:flippase [Rubrivivax sp.]